MRPNTSLPPAMHASVRLSLLAGASVPVLYFGAQALAAPFFPDFSVLALQRVSLAQISPRARQSSTQVLL